MKIILLSTNVCSAPALQFLTQSESVQAVVAPAEVNPFSQQLEQIAGGLNISVKRFSKTELTTGFKDMLTSLRPDLVLVFAFPYKNTRRIIRDTQIWLFYNVHF